MDGDDQEGDARTFRVSFSGDGAARLRDRVKEKLKEFMGDYTDDTLVEYVIVLLRNGRRKDEAKRELNVFLGDDSVDFVSWLWDHLSSHVHLYVQPKESFPVEAAKAQGVLDEVPGRCVAGNMQPDSEHEKEKPSKVSRSRRSREWKGLTQQDSELFPHQITQTENIHFEEKTDRRPNIPRQSPPPRPRLDRKRSRQDERQSMKKDAASHQAIDAPRRLLQFAVRDAMRTMQPSSSRNEPALKRLRSVVSTSTADPTLDEVSQRSRSVVRMPGAVSTAIKAAAEAAEDVRVRSSGNVFDRLRHVTERSEAINQSSSVRASVFDDGEFEDFDQVPGSNNVEYYPSSDYDRDFTGDMTMVETESQMPTDSASDNDQYDDVEVARNRGFDASQTASSANKDKGSLKLQYSVAQDTDEIVQKTRLMNHNVPVSAASKPSSKIVNISVNVNTWKPPGYQEAGNISEVESRKIVDKSELNAGKTNVRLLKENISAKAETEKEMTYANAQRESQRTVASGPGSYTTGLPSEDVDSRTLFVSNVHFAATKDTLSRHFNKFGEVLKVIIVTDAATGQPTGSAYVEFLRKESAESALSLNGTSFMSRLMKVVRRNSAHMEAAAMMGWPRITRASPYASRLSRLPYPRGALAGAFRARLPIKPGARSLQWKRETSTAQTIEGAKGPQSTAASSGKNVSSPTGRNLTYVRSESKVVGTAPE